MSRSKQTKKELIEVDAKLEELERVRPFLKSDIYYARVEALEKKKKELDDKLESGDIAPDVQFIIAEEGDE